METGLTLWAHDLAQIVKGHLHGPDRPILGACSLTSPLADHLTYLRPDYSRAHLVEAALGVGAILLARNVPDGMDDDCSVIVTPDPRHAFNVALNLLTPQERPEGWHSSATIHPTAEIHPSVSIGPYSCIGPRVRIGEDTLVRSHAVIGGPGFSITSDETGGMLHFPHFGGITIGSRVHIGSFSTIREGTLDPTEIADDVHLDDHVHVAHNCRIDRRVVITAGAKLAGSVTVEEGVWIGLNATIADGLTIGSQTLVGAGSVVLKDCEPESTYFGNPARKFS